MHLTLRQLVIFEAVVKHLSFTRAAAALHLTQPAISIQVRQLEEQLGLPLFEQIGKKIHLTEAGRELHRHSQLITQEVEAIGESIAELQGVKKGTLAIAVATTANHFTTKLMARFAQEHPGIRLHLEVTNRKRLLQQLAENEKEIVIMGKPPEGQEIYGEPFLDNPLVVIASPQHPLADHAAISLQELAGERFVLRESDSGTRNAMENFFRQYAFKLDAPLEMTSNESLKQAVAAGLGLGVVSIHTLELELVTKRLKVLPVEGFPLQRRFYIARRENKQLSPVARAFWELVVAQAERLWPVSKMLTLAGLKEACHPKTIKEDL